MAILRLDGTMSRINIDGAKAEVVSKKFVPYSPKQLQKRLKKEFGRRYVVSTTKHCVVVHPQGKGEYWAKPFDVFHSRFGQYFESKGVELSDPEFPMTVIVLRSRSDFDRYMHNEEKLHDSTVAGFYSRRTNRIVTYDPAQMLRKDSDSKESWLYQSPTVLHESAHQLCFNLGLHNRFSPPPLWLSEGVAMLFEANGFNNSREYSTLRDRVNLNRLAPLRKYFVQEKAKGKLALLIPDDKLFKTDTELAYSLSWALTFYLVEKEPDAFFEFLTNDASRKNFSGVTQTDRVENFIKAFGSDFIKLEETLAKYYFGKSAVKKSN